MRAFRGKYQPLDIDTTTRPWLAPQRCGAAEWCTSTPTRRYAFGWRCDDHSAPADFTGAFTMITGRLFDGTEFTR